MNAYAKLVLAIVLAACLPQQFALADATNEGVLVQYNFRDTPAPYVLQWYESVTGVRVEGGNTALGAISLTSTGPVSMVDALAAVTNALQQLGLFLDPVTGGVVRVRQTNASPGQPAQARTSYLERRRARIEAGVTNTAEPSTGDAEMKVNLEDYREVLATAVSPVVSQRTYMRREPAIVQAIRNGDIQQIQLFLDLESGDISLVKDGDGMNLLHHAVWQRQLEIARLLLDRGIDVNATDSSGLTPLHQAVGMEAWALIPLLLERGADPAIPNNGNDTPLETALYRGSTNVAKMLATAGAPLDFFTAAGLGRMDRVEEYLDEGADWRVRFEDYAQDGIILSTTLSDPRGKSPGSYRRIFNNSPLHWAAVGGRVDVAKLLITRGVPVQAVNSQGETALHWAARGGCAEMVELLSTSHQDVAVADRSGQTPLHCAAQNGHLEAARVLLSQAADVNAEDRFWKKTPLLLAARMADNPALIRLLVGAGANVNAVDHEGENALHRLALSGAEHAAETARILIAAGASTSACNKEGETPLDVAMSATGCHGNEEIVKALQEAGED